MEVLVWIASGIGMDLMEVLSISITFVSAKLSHKPYEEVQQTCGADVYPFYFQLVLDGTPIASGGVGKKSITPVNIRVLQMKIKQPSMMKLIVVLLVFHHLSR